jgi:hypothetical protein
MTPDTPPAPSLPLGAVIIDLTELTIRVGDRYFRLVEVAQPPSPLAWLGPAGEGRREGD